MDYIQYFLVSFLFLFPVIIICHIICSIISTYKAKRKSARLSYQLITLTYEHLILVRSLHYKAKFIENDAKRQELLEYYANAYKRDLEVLDDPRHILYKNYLPSKEKEKLEETLALPRYELI